MDKKRVDKIAVMAGSALYVNGGLLLVTPGRFATIRKAGWMPDRVNGWLQWMADHDRKGRMIGLGLAAVGLSLLAFGVSREPAAG